MRQLLHRLLRLVQFLVLTPWLCKIDEFACADTTQACAPRSFPWILSAQRHSTTAHWPFWRIKISMEAEGPPHLVQFKPIRQAAFPVAKRLNSSEWTRQELGLAFLP
jgi:hypothetical protein